MLVLAGFAAGFAVAAKRSGERHSSPPAEAVSAGASRWGDGFARGVDAGAMVGYERGSARGEAIGRRAAIDELARAPDGPRSESRRDIGYRPDKDAVGELPTLPPGSLTPAKYLALWAQVSPADKAWAKRVSYCESGGDPTTLGLGGSYRGAFQFTPNAWRIAPNSPGGDPIDYSWMTQAVVAVSLKHAMGTGPWPVCGTR